MEFCMLPTTKKLSIHVESLHFPNVFRKMPQMRKSTTEMAMENCKMVMEKLWKNILSGLWEP